MMISRAVPMSKGSDTYQAELRLDRHMIDVKRLKDKIDVVIFCVDILRGIEDNVNRGESLLRSQTPDMKFMNTGDAWNLNQKQRLSLTHINADWTITNSIPKQCLDFIWFESTRISLKDKMHHFSH